MTLNSDPSKPRTNALFGLRGQPRTNELFKTLILSSILGQNLRGRKWGWIPYSSLRWLSYVIH